MTDSVLMLDGFPQVWRPAPGDELEGILTARETRMTRYGECPFLTIGTDHDGIFVFHARHALARRELLRLDPHVGDRIRIAYHGPEPVRGYECYEIAILVPDPGSAGVETSTAEGSTDNRKPRNAGDARQAGGS